MRLHDNYEKGRRKASNSFRIPYDLWSDEERFRHLLDLFDKYPGVTDQITLFTSGAHSPLPVEEVYARSLLMQRRMKDVGDRGYLCGINILATLGHHDENLEYSLPEEYTRMTDINGNICRGSLCPNDAGSIAYVKKLYEIIACAGPDYIWIDDDIRLGWHMPVAGCCFCDGCIGLFSQATGKAYTGASLKSALNEGAEDNKIAVRREWLNHNRKTISNLLQVIEETVHGIKPGTSLGFMSGERFWEGYDFDAWARVLAGPEKAGVLWRPGGGFYCDDRLKDLTGKAHEIGRQVSLLPQDVKIIQSEVENFPYHLLRKSAKATCVEAAAYIAAGCTGTAFNILPEYDSVADYEPLLRKIHDTLPFYDSMADAFGRSGTSGIYTGWCTDSYVTSNLSEGDWNHGSSFMTVAWHGDELLETGLPVSYSSENACLYAISGNSVLAWDRRHIEEMLSKGVLMDAAALQTLNALGYEELTGFRVEKVFSADCIEEFTAHHFNNGIAGIRRNCRQSFNKAGAAVLAPLEDSAGILGRLVDYNGKELASCCMGIYSNKMGGRICVSGYYPWSYLQSRPKAGQLKALAVWLAGGLLPAYIASYHRVNLWVRNNEAGGLSVALLNTSLDSAEKVSLKVCGRQGPAYITAMDGKTMQLACVESRDGYSEVVIPEISSWEMCIVTVKS